MLLIFKLIGGGGPKAFSMKDPDIRHNEILTILNYAFNRKVDSSRRKMSFILTPLVLSPPFISVYLQLQPLLLNV